MQLDSDAESDDGDDPALKIVPSKKTGRPGVSDQPPRVARVARDAIQETEALLCLKNAFPEGPEKFTSFIGDILVDAAKKHNDVELVNKLKTDSKYAHKLAQIVSSPSFCIIRLLSTHIDV